jgi:hypothetical protein
VSAASCRVTRIASAAMSISESCRTLREFPRSDDRILVGRRRSSRTRAGSHRHPDPQPTSLGQQLTQRQVRTGGVSYGSAVL